MKPSNSMGHRKLSNSEIYRRLHCGDPSEIELYRALCRGAESVLDLGCGWGRIALPLARAGHHIVAVDIEPSFLEQLDREVGQEDLSRLVCTVQQDITRLDLDDRLGADSSFDRIVVAYNTMYALGGARGVEQLLSAARRHARAGCHLCFDVYDMDDFDESQDAGPSGREHVATWQDDGGPIRVFESTRVLFDQKRLVVSYEAELDNGEVVGSLETVHDYLTSEEIERLLGAAGWELVERYARVDTKRAWDDDDDDDDDEDDEGGTVYYIARAT